MQSPSSDDITPPIMRSRYWIITITVVSILAVIRGLGNLYPTEWILSANKVVDWLVVFVFLLTIPIMVIPWNNLTSAIRFYRSRGEVQGIHINISLSMWVLALIYVILYKIPYIKYLFLCFELLNFLTLLIVLRYRSLIRIRFSGSLLILGLTTRLIYQGFGTYWLL